MFHMGIEHHSSVFTYLSCKIVKVDGGDWDWDGHAGDLSPEPSPLRYTGIMNNHSVSLSDFLALTTRTEKEKNPQMSRAATLGLLDSDNL